MNMYESVCQLMRNPTESVWGHSPVLLRKWKKMIDLVFFLGRISTWKIRFRSIQRIFMGKWPNSPDFGKQKTQIYMKCFSRYSQEYRRILAFFLLSYLVFSQIRLNYLMDDPHFSSITKSRKKNPCNDPLQPLPLRRLCTNPYLKVSFVIK
jgi:hypothetical protein